VSFLSFDAWIVAESAQQHQISCAAQQKTAARNTSLSQQLWRAGRRKADESDT